MARALAIVIASFFVCALATTAAAQSPRAGGPAPGDDPTSRIGADLGITGNLARGFVDRDLVAARGVVQGWDGPWGLYVQPYWLYGRIGTPAGKITTDNEVYLRIGLFRSLTPRFFVYGVNALDHSLRRKIDVRNLTGAGAGVNIVAQKGLSLLASVGVLGEHADFFTASFEDHAEIMDDTRNVLRTSLRVYGRYKLAGGKLNLTHDFYYIPNPTEIGDDYRIMFYGALDAPIVKGFSARVQTDVTYEGLIQVGTKHDDLVLTFGVAYKNEWALNQPAPPPATPAGTTNPSPAR